MQARYQGLNLMIRKRKKEPNALQFRWKENGELKSVLIGTVEKVPTLPTQKGPVTTFASRAMRRIPSSSFTP